MTVKSMGPNLVIRAVLKLRVFLHGIKISEPVLPFV